jgi:acetyl esterase/lipase
MIRSLLALSLVCLLAAPLAAQVKKKAPPARPEPTASDYAYAKDSERQKFDFWQAKSDTPTPVVLLIHGGGWMGGDKSS